MHPDTLHRYSAYRAACKQWGIALGVGILLVGALGKLEAASLLYAALPLLLLALVEAGYAGQERRCAELMNSKKGNDDIAALLPESAVASIVRTARATLSVGVWPFYLGLFGIVAAGSGVLMPARLHPATVAAVTPGAVKKPVQQYLQTTTGPIPLPTAGSRPSGPTYPGRPPGAAGPGEVRTAPPFTPLPGQPGARPMPPFPRAPVAPVPNAPDSKPPAPAAPATAPGAPVPAPPAGNP